MSKLAHSNDATMREIDIRNAWRNFSEHEACEAFNEMGCDPIDDVERLCGAAAFKAYMKWIQVNLK